MEGVKFKKAPLSFGIGVAVSLKEIAFAKARVEMNLLSRYQALSGSWMDQPVTYQALPDHMGPVNR